MASIGNLRTRRSAGQLQALAGVEREIRTHDHNGSRKYLRAFADAFRSYEMVLTPEQVQQMAVPADVVLIADYHALPSCQRYAAEFLERRSMVGDRPVVLGVETIFARDQHVLDEWWRREIEPIELRERMRFDREWGYEWSPFYDLLVAAREHGEAIYGLDCAPRQDLRKIGARDRHAAQKIADIRQRHPDAVIVVLFGESHLAPDHLPQALRECLPDARPLTILQNVDALYWAVSGEQPEHVPAVRVSSDVVCVFNASPLEKYENYRLCLERWRSENPEDADLRPTVNNLVDGLAGFLGINRYAAHNRTQPRFLVDMLPEVYGAGDESTVHRLLARQGVSESERKEFIQIAETGGCVYLPQINAVYMLEFHMEGAAEAAARFLHHACRGLPDRRKAATSSVLDPADRFYRSAIEIALAYFGSRILHPGREAHHEDDVRLLAELTREELERQATIPWPQAMRGLDFVLRHRARESGSRTAPHEDFEKEIVADDAVSAYASLQLGLLLGCDLYDAYLEGWLSPASIRGFFLMHLERAREAREAYLAMVRRIRGENRRVHRTLRSE